MNPLSGVTVTVKVRRLARDDRSRRGDRDLEVGGGGSTVIVRVGGLGSELPLASMTVSERDVVPGVLKVTFPGSSPSRSPAIRRERPRSIWRRVVLVLKKTDPPAVIVTSAGGRAIAPRAATSCRA